MSAGPIRVLVVDDDDTLRINLHAYFEDEGFAVTSVRTGEEGVNEVRRREFDIVLSDMRLPGMDGAQTILAMHVIKPGLRFLVYTGSPKYQVGHELDAIGVRAGDLFKKPIRDMAVLADAIRAKCGGGRA